MSSSRTTKGVRREGIARGGVVDAEVIDELVERVTRKLSGKNLALLVNEACFTEERRIGKRAGEADYLRLLRSTRRKLARGSDDDLEDAVEALVRHYAEEIHGHFDVNLYARAPRALPKGLELLLKSQKPWKLFRRKRRGLNLVDRVRCSGELATIDSLVERGTVVLVPTHSSNFDSPAIGFALHASGLPPVIYGAGINLFTNWLLSYFMDHLGAYKVDRRKTHALYKVCLKEYSTLAIRRRWHSLFFPGGTRSRSGRIERGLKKGLMGTGLEAYKDNLREGRELPRVFFVPATINYQLVLEAETLIDDALKEAGKSRYIITDDEFSRPDKVLSYVWNTLEVDNPIEVVFGAPLDPFGNRVNADGDSLDPTGRPFDPAEYVCRDGDVVEDSQRDRVYTQRLAESISDSFFEHTVLFPCNVVAAAAQRRIEARYPALDLFERLLLTDDERCVPLGELDVEVSLLVDRLRKLAGEGRVRLGGELASGTIGRIREDGVAALGRYHARAAVRVEGETVWVEEPRLALFYANRLVGYPLPEIGASA
jgi:glycerol-3-phosphate O-acyltransferase